MDKKNSSIPLDKKGKIRSQSAKYNVFCGPEASSIISSVTLYRITKNCNCHTLCSSLITIHHYGQEKIIMLFSFYNVMEMGLKLEVRNFYPVNFMVRHIYVYKCLQSLLASKNIIEHTSPKSLRFFKTIDTKVHYQTLATLKQSELQFRSSANARKF